ncbi:MAG: HNH endonuclease [Solirubrobacterales bacterium]
MKSKVRRGGRPYRRLAKKIRREQQVCHLCGLPIDPDLKPPHPGSFTVDHIVPLSMGGKRDDPANCRAAHRLCNMKRGAGKRSPRTQGDRSASW